MPDALQVLLSGVVLGFSVAAPPGPINALAAQQVTTRSWLSGWLTLLGAMTADAIFFVLTFYGVSTLVTPRVRSSLFVFGGILMLYLAYSTVNKARAGDKSFAAPRLPRSRFPFVLGLSIGLTNPYQLGWWIAVGAGMVSEFGGNIVAGFFAGILSWTIIFSAVVHTGVTRYRKLSPLVAYASAITMGAFGLWFLGSGLLATF